MLMLVVTIVIAAVVSAFAGGLATTTPKAPTLAMDISIASTGEPTDSHITFDVQSVSIPISTSHLKIITSWISASGISGGNTSEMGLNSPNVYTDDPWSFLYHGKQMSGQTVDQHQTPLGYGQGINGTQVSAGTIGMNQWFGNYTLVTRDEHAGGAGFRVLWCIFRTDSCIRRYGTNIAVYLLQQ